MNTSYYGSKSKVIKNRAYGYQERPSGYVNADYISMTIPYAAGSLMSTIDDLLSWNTAIRNHKLISKENGIVFSRVRKDNKIILFLNFCRMFILLRECLCTLKMKR